MKCDRCAEEFSADFPDVTYNHWLQLMHYFQHERDEDEITDATYESMVGCLMLIKPKPE